MIKRVSLVAALLTGIPVLAAAGPASDAVKTFYAPVGFEADPAMRDRFVDPAKSVFEQYDKSSANSEEVGCIDFVLAIDAQDYDQGELDRTLKLAETVSGNEATVMATFSLFPDSPEAARSIEWSLKKVGAEWKVSDIVSKANGWRLSSFDCG